jgi:hypothetical protein
MFQIDTGYTRAEICSQLGGSRVSCLPMNQGAVVAVCVTRDFNPDAPEVILCGQGRRTRPVSELFAHQGQPTPVFIKRKAHQWIYQGLFVVAESLTSGPRFESFIAGSRRTIASVSFVVLLRPVR